MTTDPKDFSNQIKEIQKQIQNLSPAERDMFVKLFAQRIQPILEEQRNNLQAIYDNLADQYPEIAFYQHNKDYLHELYPNFTSEEIIQELKNNLS